MKVENVFRLFLIFKILCMPGTSICKGRYFYKGRCIIGPTANIIALTTFTAVAISFNNESRAGGILLTKQPFLYEERRLAFKHDIFYSITTPFLVEFITGTL